MQRWTEQETAILADTSLTYDEIKVLIPHRTRKSIVRKCQETNLPRTESKYVSALKANPTLQDLVAGHLLGDGHLDKRYGTFFLTSIHKEYAEWCQSIINIEAKKTHSIYVRPATSRGRVSYRAHLGCKEFLWPIKKKWYKNDRKVVPKDLRLNPAIIQRWYMDDGNLYVSKKHRIRCITLSTDGFDLDDVLFLQSELIRFGLKTGLKNTRNRYKIAIYGKLPCKEFLDLIGQPPVECFKYKWELT